jgi:glycine dehydrogenase
LLDEASAGAEALYMAYNLHEGERVKFFVDEKVFVTTQAVVQTKARNLGIEIVKGKYEDFLQKHNPSEFFGVLVQSPDVNGILHDFTELFKKLSETKTIKVVASDLLALTITKPPGEMGADICFGSAQRFGIPMGYGGPYAGFFATKNISIDKK